MQKYDIVTMEELPIEEALETFRSHSLDSYWPVPTEMMMTDSIIFFMEPMYITIEIYSLEKGHLYTLALPNRLNSISLDRTMLYYKLDRQLCLEDFSPIDPRRNQIFTVDISNNFNTMRVSKTQLFATDPESLIKVNLVTQATETWYVEEDPLVPIREVIIVQDRYIYTLATRTYLVMIEEEDFYHNIKEIKVRCHDIQTLKVLKRCEITETIDSNTPNTFGSIVQCGSAIFVSYGVHLYIFDTDLKLLQKLTPSDSEICQLHVIRSCKKVLIHTNEDSFHISVPDSYFGSFHREMNHIESFYDVYIRTVK